MIIRFLSISALHVAKIQADRFLCQLQNYAKIPTLVLIRLKTLDKRQQMLKNKGNYSKATDQK